MGAIKLPGEIKSEVKVTKMEELYKQNPEYQKICEEANERIRESQINQAKAYIKAKNFIALK